MVKWEHKIGQASELSEEEKREFVRLVKNLEPLLDDRTDQLGADSQAQSEPEADK